MKKTFSEVAVADNGGIYSVALDERPLKTPGEAEFALPTRRLAEAIATEWRSQGEEIDPKSMPLTMIACAAVDRVAPAPDGAIDAVMRYATTDLLCYRTEQPAQLVKMQDQTWQPLLDWASARLGVKLETTVGIVPIEQDSQALASLRACLLAYDHFSLAALHVLTGTLGSIILALAVAEGQINVAQALDASQLDETFQASQWGEVDEAADRSESVLAEATTAVHFLMLLRA